MDEPLCFKLYSAVFRSKYCHVLFTAKITSRPGQEGVCNGYILEGDELNEMFSNPQMKLLKAEHQQSNGESATSNL